MSINMSSPLYFVALVIVNLVCLAASAHPSTGIVVDGQGQVFFQDIAGDVIWKIDAEGKLAKFSDKVGGQHPLTPARQKNPLPRQQLACP